MSEYTIINGQLYHHGIKGQKWGKRRFQTKDGSWTPAGRERYSTAFGGKIAAYKEKKANSEVGKAKTALKEAKAAEKQAKKDAANTPEAKAARKAKAIKAAKVGAAVAGTALAAYGAYKVNEYVKTKNCQIAAERGRKLAEESFERMAKQSYDDFVKTGALRSEIYEDLNADARYYAKAASKDKFSKAAKNVMNYRKENGKYGLEYLPSVESYNREAMVSLVLDRRKK